MISLVSLRRCIIFVAGVAGISPLLQGRNGYFLSIGQNDRFLVVDVENKIEMKQKGQKRKKGWKPLCKESQGLAPRPCKNMLENLQTNNGNLQAKMGQIKLNKQDKMNIIPSFGGMGQHALAWRSTSLSQQWGSHCSMGGRMRGSVGGLRDKWSQDIHSSNIMVCKGEVF